MGKVDLRDLAVKELGKQKESLQMLLQVLEIKEQVSKLEMRMRARAVAEIEELTAKEGLLSEHVEYQQTKDEPNET